MKLSGKKFAYKWQWGKIIGFFGILYISEDRMTIWSYNTIIPYNTIIYGHHWQKVRISPNLVDCSIFVSILLYASRDLWHSNGFALGISISNLCSQSVLARWLLFLDHESWSTSSNFWGIRSWNSPRGFLSELLSSITTHRIQHWHHKMISSFWHSNNNHSVFTWTMNLNKFNNQS